MSFDMNDCFFSFSLIYTKALLTSFCVLQSKANERERTHMRKQSLYHTAKIELADFRIYLRISVVTEKECEKKSTRSLQSLQIGCCGTNDSLGQSVQKVREMKKRKVNVQQGNLSVVKKEEKKLSKFGQIVCVAPYQPMYHNLYS